LVKNLSNFFSEWSDIKIIPNYKTFKVDNYYDLKSQPLKLYYPMLYVFFNMSDCLCHADQTYIGKSARNLVGRVNDLMNFEVLKIRAEKVQLRAPFQLHCV